MDYFQGVVTEYLRADRAVFVNAQCLLQLDPGEKLEKGRHWYCDIVALDLREETAYLCEITYDVKVNALVRRLREWDAHWTDLVSAIRRDCRVPAHWRVRPWAFIAQRCRATLVSRIQWICEAPGRMPAPRVTDLESVLPWSYRPGFRRNDVALPDSP
jgi:hypothetical protein